MIEMLKNTVLRDLWRDDQGALIATEWLFIVTIMVIGLVVGLAYIRNAVTFELSEVAQAIGCLDQGYMYPGLAGKFDPNGEAQATTNGVNAVNPHIRVQGNLRYLSHVRTRSDRRRPGPARGFCAPCLNRPGGSPGGLEMDWWGFKSDVERAQGADEDNCSNDFTPTSHMATWRSWVQLVPHHRPPLAASCPDCLIRALVPEQSNKITPIWRTVFPFGDQ